MAPGSFLSNDLSGITELTTLQGSTVALRTEGEDLFVNDARVVSKDVQASNGVVQAVDKVLLLPVGPLATPTPTPTAEPSPTDTPSPSPSPALE